MAARGPEQEAGAARRRRAGGGRLLPPNGREGSRRGAPGDAARALDRVAAIRVGPGPRGDRDGGGAHRAPRGSGRAPRAPRRLGARFRRRAAARRSGGRRCGKLDAAGLVLVVGRIEVEDPLRREEARHPEPHEVARPLASEVEGHDLDPDRGIGRRPGLGLEPEDEELGGQRTRPALHPGVDPADVGVDPAPRAGGEVGQAGLRPAVEAEHPQKAVGGEGGRPQDLGETARADPPIHLHLPQPVLGVDVAESEEGVLLVPGEHVRDAVPVAHHFHRLGEAGDGPFAVDLGERPPKPQVAARRPDGGEREEGERRPGAPLQEYGHAGSSPTRMEASPEPLRRHAGWSRAPAIAPLPPPVGLPAAPGCGGADPHASCLLMPSSRRSPRSHAPERGAGSSSMKAAAPPWRLQGGGDRFVERRAGRTRRAVRRLRRKARDRSIVEAVELAIEKARDPALECIPGNGAHPSPRAFETAIPRARRSSDRPRGDLRRDRPDASGCGSPAMRTRARSRAPRACGPSTPTPPSGAGTPARTALVFPPSGHLLRTMIGGPAKRGNSRDMCAVGFSPGLPLANALGHGVLGTRVSRPH